MSAGGFNRLKCIGDGTFGKVWLIKCTGNSKSYVLKEVKVAGLTKNETVQAVTEVKFAVLFHKFEKRFQAFIHLEGNLSYCS